LRRSQRTLLASGGSRSVKIGVSRLSGTFPRS